MGRIAIGLAAGLTVWFGSMVAAEAQPTITTTGPTAMHPGDTTANYQAAIGLVTPSGFRVRLWVYRNGIQVHYSENAVPNPGITNPTFNRTVPLSGCSGGDVFKYCAKLLVGTSTITAVDWSITVSGTRPTSKPMQVEKRPTLDLQTSDRDRRRE